MYEFFIARKYICDGGGFVTLISAFSFTGIAIGVATLIVVMSVMSGFHDRLSNYIIQIRGHVHISSKPSIIEHEELERAIKNITGVDKVSSTYQAEVILMANGTMSGVFLSGLSRGIEDTLLGTMRAGSIEGFNAGDGLAIGSELAKTLGVRIGDTVSVAAAGAGPIPIMEDFKVVAIFEFGMWEYDSHMAYLKLEAVNDLTGTTGVNNMEIVLNSNDDTQKIAGAIKVIAPGDARVRTWQEDNNHFVNAIKVEQTVMFFILTLMICVAAFNIISSLVILAQEKQHEIAILKTMGASNCSVVAIFLICGSFIGCFGTLIGVMLGLGFAYNIEGIRRLLEKLTGIAVFDPVIYFFSDLPATINPKHVFEIALMSIALSVLAATLPAIRASRYSPSALLRS